MPIYEYRCPKCSAEFEELVFGDDIPECPECGCPKSERLLSCACLHMPAPSRVGQVMPYGPGRGGCVPGMSGGGGGCGGCTASSCAGCK
jgi:putative FmdB family regulatory protein